MQESGHRSSKKKKDGHRSSKSEAILSCKDLVKNFGKRAVVNGVSLEVSTGKVIGLLGPNGAGKTTVFYMLVGLLFPDNGHIFLDKEDVTMLALHSRARLGLGYLAQEPSLFKKLSVYDNVAMAAEARGLNGEEVHNLTQSLIRRFGLEHVSASTASSLSGGERRRCEIARCLAINPHFVLLDEPFAGIDPIAVKEIQHLISDLKHQGIGVLITDHNVRETLGSCDYCYLLRDGKIFFKGTPDEITNNEEARRFYLGSDFKL